MGEASTRSMLSSFPAAGAAERRGSRAWQVGRLPAGPGFVILAGFLLAALLAPAIAPYDPVEQGLGPGLTPPGRPYLLGLDSLGRDVASRLVYGARTSLLVATLTVSIALLGGLALGLPAGYHGGVPGAILMRLTDAILSFPPILLAMALMASLGPDLRSVIVALGIVYTPRYVHLVRVGALGAREEGHVIAARAVGAGDGRILARHVLPTILGPVVVQASFTLGEAIVAEAALGLLGIGTQPPTPSWGLMLADARAYLTQAAWYPAIVGSAVSLAVLAVNLVGDGIRDVLDPRSAAGREVR